MRMPPKYRKALGGRCSLSKYRPAPSAKNGNGKTKVPYS